MTTHKHFGEKTGAMEVAEGFSNQIHGKVVLIVGISPNSLGESMALAFSSQSPSLLILASRTFSKIEAVIKTLRASFASVRIELVTVDLSGLSSVRSAAATISSLTPRIDILINNAALVTPQHSLTATGIELQLATTFVGPWLLTNLLLPQLLAVSSQSSPDATRIINVTSAGHNITPFRFSDPNFHQPLSSLPESERPGPHTPSVFIPKDGETYNGFLSYGQSKTANCLHTVYINEHLAPHIMSYSVHPGSIWTELSRNLDDEMQKVIKSTGGFWKSLDQGGATMMVAALDPVLGDVEAGREGGWYLSDCQMGKSAEHARGGRGREDAERLWVWAEGVCGQRFDISKYVKACEGVSKNGVEVNRRL